MPSTSGAPLGVGTATALVTEVEGGTKCSPWLEWKALSGTLDEATLKSGRMRILVGLFNLGCSDNEDRLTFITEADNFSLCVTRRSGPVTSLPSEGRREDIALDSWTPLVVFKPYLGTPGKLVVDANKRNWTVVLLYFSGRAELSGPLPSTDSVFESLR